ncbi:MAG: squalene synthase HpnC [Gammaproteobacteria bacterium]|nr:squalene synthase HpnC [Gammaproteobacteria bacterium]
MITIKQTIHNAYLHCMAIAQNHYENFPVASKLLSQSLRFPICAVYAFARSADDFADEGNHSQAHRLHLLNAYQNELINIEQYITHYPSLKNTHHCNDFYYASDQPIFIALADVIYHYQLPISLFYDLLKAFKQDVNVTRYSTFSELLAYCQLSANPIGRILLYLNKSASPENIVYSDAICTGLQLINFYQDIAQDMDETNRLYLPLDDMQALGVGENDIKQHINNKATNTLIKQQLIRTHTLYYSGKPLCHTLSGRFALEIRLIFLSGACILKKLEKNTHNIYLRPRLHKKDTFKIIWQGVFFKFLH